ncbi:MAG: hypothetical protein JWN63_2307 [Candidatus Acidoferrum typicum]|jgi:hypothetical protein|nr:hypothetical protein [Candidatus Acidoferrum typicum]
MVTPREDAMARRCLRQRDDDLRHVFLVVPHRLRSFPPNTYHSLLQASITWK